MLREEKLKWRWYWRKKEAPPQSPPPFSHNPPGHNCGLPCCNQTAEVEVKPIQNQRGCVVVPVLTPAELSESNFVMKRAKRPSSLFSFGKSRAVRSNSEISFGTFSETTKVAARRSMPPSVSQCYRDSTPDDNDNKNVLEEDDVSDDDFDEDTLGRRLIKVEHRAGVFAPEPSAELIAMHGLEAVEESATLLRRRNKPLAQWEQIKHRHFTLPDSPQTPHRIMFLNHQPGESTDYYCTQDRSNGMMSPGGQLNTSTLKSDLMNTLQKYETLAKEQEKLSKDNDGRQSNNNSDNLSNIVNTMDIAKHDTGDCKSLLSDKSVSIFSRDDHSPDRRGSKARILDTSLPPVPKEEPSIRESFRSGGKTDSLIEEDNESLVDDSDHIYDVVNDVKAASEKLALVQKTDEEKLVENIEIEGEKGAIVDGQIENKNLSRVKSSVSDLLDTLPVSDRDNESGSVAYHASVSDCNTESYIYNGSLLSQRINTDNNENISNDNSIYYQGSLLDPKIIAERSKNPIIFIMGGKPIVLNKLNGYTTNQNESDGDFQPYYNSSQQSDTSCSSSEHRIVPKLQIDYNMKRRLSLIDSHGEDFVNSPNPTPPTVKINGLDYSGGMALSGLNIESSTKLKLWDLRLITINREENNYSTYPPRRPASEDLCLGSFSRTPDLGFRHRHNSDVATDQYVGQKIQRILRSPVLTRSSGVANFCTGSTLDDNYFDSLNYDLALKTLHKIDGFGWKDGKCDNGIGSSGNFLNTSHMWNDEKSNGDSKLGNLSLYPSVFDAEEESLIYESPSFCGIYRLSLQNKSSGSDSIIESSGSRVSGSDGGGGGKNDGFHRGGGGGGGVVGNKSHSGGGSVSKGGSSGLYDGGSSLYGGSIYGSTFGWGGVGEYSNNNDNGNNEKKNIGNNDHDKENKMWGKKKKDGGGIGQVVWGDASFVDWRRQAQLFKDRHFITMIL